MVTNFDRTQNMSKILKLIICSLSIFYGQIVQSKELYYECQYDIPLDLRDFKLSFLINEELRSIRLVGTHQISTNGFTQSHTSLNTFQWERGFGSNSVWTVNQFTTSDDGPIGDIPTMGIFLFNFDHNTLLKTIIYNDIKNDGTLRSDMITEVQRLNCETINNNE